jgi:hypothetical protein
MTINISALNGLSVNELDSSIPVDSATGYNSTTMTVTANPLGFSQGDNWNGTAPGSPQNGDLLSLNFTVANASSDLVTYTQTLSNGAGGTYSAGSTNGAVVVGYDNHDALLALLNVGDITNTADLSGEYIVVGDIDLSQTEGLANPVTALAFGTTGNSEFLGITGQAVPEPSVVLLMPVMVVGLMIARIPAVRSFMGGR